MILLAILRGLHLAATLSVFGALLFRAAVLPATLANVSTELSDHVLDRLRMLVRLSIAAAFATAAIWLLAQAAAMSEADSMTELVAAIPIVLLHTVFGHALLALGNGRSAVGAACGAGLAGGACILQARMGHAAVAEGVLLPAAVAAHVLATGAWLGGLAPLWLAIRHLPHLAAARVARRFSPIGMGAVAVLAATAVAQGWERIGRIAAVLNTTYGQLALAKAALFALLLGLAAANRQVFMPGLARDASARRRLERSIAAEVGLGMLLIAAASFMAGLPPAAMRMAQEPASGLASALPTTAPAGWRPRDHARCS